MTYSDRVSSQIAPLYQEVAGSERSFRRKISPGRHKRMRGPQAPAPRETILSAVGMPAEHQVRTDQYFRET